MNRPGTSRRSEALNLGRRKSHEQQALPGKFKNEAVKQVTDRGRAVADVANRIGVSQYSLYERLKRYSMPGGERLELQGQSAEIRRLKTELKRVTEERDILKKVVASPKGISFGACFARESR